jgi:hypothetical protein
VDEVGEYLKGAKEIEIDYHQRATKEFMSDLQAAGIAPLSQAWKGLLF